MSSWLGKEFLIGWIIFTQNFEVITPLSSDFSCYCGKSGLCFCQSFICALFFPSRSFQFTPGISEFHHDILWNGFFFLPPPEHLSLLSGNCVLQFGFFSFLSFFKFKFKLKKRRKLFSHHFLSSLSFFGPLLILYHLFYLILLSYFLERFLILYFFSLLLNLYFGYCTFNFQVSFLIFDCFLLQGWNMFCYFSNMTECFFSFLDCLCPLNTCCLFILWSQLCWKFPLHFWWPLAFS